MANLNLSEFTEKTFVADADWTFVWDTAGAISKKVSRNNWLNSGTLTGASAPITVSQTWNDAAVAFTALKVNAVSTASDAASLLADFQVGAVSQFKITKGGAVTANSSLSVNGNVTLTSGAAWFSGYLNNFYASGSAIIANQGAYIGFAAANNQTSNGGDVTLYRDGAGQLALRNGINPQTFNVYGTFTTAVTNFERLAIKYNATDVAYQIAAEKGSTNGDYRPLDFVTGGSRRMTIGTTGNVGIGTTAPAAKLDVAGSIQFNTIAIARSGVIGILPNSTSGLYFGYDSIGDRSFFLSATTNSSGGILTRKPAIFDYTTFTFTRDGVNPDLFINGSGNVGIGTTAPSSKLQVSAGDVEVDTITKGVILKSPDGTRYRVTVANGGTLSVAAV